ncbi:MAG: hypothetical protein FWF28_01240 [Micrococcales bacterium]|nr:hypothetical protein [Micrococcales bacterium]
MSRVAGAVVGAVAVGLLSWLLVLDWAVAVCLAVAVLVAVLALQRVEVTGEPRRSPPARVTRSGERREAQTLTWALAGHDGRVSSRALQQLQQAGAHRLARHGLDVGSPDDDDALRALVGPRVLATLRCDRDPLPRLADVGYALAVLDRIGSGGSARATVPRSNPR